MVVTSYARKFAYRIYTIRIEGEEYILSRVSMTTRHSSANKCGVHCSGVPKSSG